jgi:hypothetical protein
VKEIKGGEILRRKMTKGLGEGEEKEHPQFTQIKWGHILLLNI